MGGDSAGMVGGVVMSLKNPPKVFTVGPFLMGGTWSFRMIQLLQYKLNPPKQGKMSVMRYMATSFTDAVMDCFSKGGLQQVDKEVKRGGMFLVGYKGQLFRIESDYAVNQRRQPYHSCGSGEDWALGSLHASEHICWDPGLRVKRALEASAEFCTGVTKPFTIVGPWK
jgi:ATP-dependent protease HslVU (ClpYQ) peptidase subunit